MDNFWKLEDYQKDWLMENQIIINRFKSFLWRFGAYIVSIGLVWLTDNLVSLELSPFVTTLIGLGLGELSKIWAVKQKLQGKTFLGKMIKRPKEDDRV